MAMAIRSSTTARVSRKIRRAVGRCEPMTASTATANAMSVAVGIGPAAHGLGVAPVDRGEDQRRDHDAAGGRRDRNGGLAGLAQVAGDEFAS